MAQAADPVSPPPEEISADIADAAHSAQDSLSDNESSEKSARDQLQKTSIASYLSKSTTSIPGNQQQSVTEIETDQQPASAPPVSSSITHPSQHSRTESPRGRSDRKRTLDRSDFANAEPNIDHRETSESVNGHLRKRSRDVRSGDVSNVEGRSLKIPSGDTVREELEENADYEVPDRPSNDESSPISNDKGKEADATSPIRLDEDSGAVSEESRGKLDHGSDVHSSAGHKTKGEIDDHIEDQQMEDGTSSPRRKRSRDQLDADADREQKIAATDIARAQRRSDEINRADFADQDQSEAMGLEQPQGSEQKKSTFGAPSSLRAPSSPPSSRTTPDNNNHGTSAAKSASSSAFASSGFAALASSSTSPFGALGGKAFSETSKGFGASKASPLTATSSNIQSHTSGVSTGFGSFAKAGSSTESAKASPFAAAAAGVNKGGGTFGGSVFGSGFGTGFSSGNKLSSFAAPTGDTKFGSTNGSVKPIGSPIDETRQDGDADSGGEETEGQSGDGENSESGERFQQRNVETGEDGEMSIFLSRASLYTFKENTWKEAGKGTFKLNVPTAASGTTSTSTDSAGQDSFAGGDGMHAGRFIMRAHQTYRVLVNAPIFRQMKVGDSQGNEPSGKSFGFAVIEAGRPTPYMVKLGDAGESKDLYQKVRKLQQEAKL